MLRSSSLTNSGRPPAKQVPLSLAKDEDAKTQKLRENIRSILIAQQKALASIKTAVMLTNDPVNKAARATIDAVENAITVCQKEISKLG